MSTHRARLDLAPLPHPVTNNVPDVVPRGGPSDSAIVYIRGCCYRWLGARLSRVLDTMSKVAKVVSKAISQPGTKQTLADAYKLGGLKVILDGNLA